MQLCIRALKKCSSSLLSRRMHAPSQPQQVVSCAHECGPKTAPFTLQMLPAVNISSPEGSGVTVVARHSPCLTAARCRQTTCTESVDRQACKRQICGAA